MNFKCIILIEATVKRLHLYDIFESHSVVSNSVRPHGLEPARLLCPWDSPGQNTGVGSLSLLQRERGSSQFRCWTQVSQIAGEFFTIWAPGKPTNTGVGSLPLLQDIFPTQDQTWVFCTAGRFFTSWATRKGLRKGTENKSVVARKWRCGRDGLQRSPRELGNSWKKIVSCFH